MPDAPATVAELPPDPTQPTPPQPTDAPPPKRKRRQPSAEELSDRKIKKWSEIFETAILTLATVATVWAGYQSGQWSGIQSSSNVQSISQRIEASELANSAQQLELVDVALFSNWVNAIAAEDQVRADFYAKRFRAEFKPAFDAWLATQPLTNLDAPSSPFVMDDYKVSQREKAAEKEVAAAEASAEGERAGSIGDQFTLTAVILAGSLLLAGLASRFDWEELRAVVVAVALLVLLFCVVRLVMLPMA
ncbi:MAG: hypothetical protein U0X20_22480 [Caldilineaceae bacterium]